MEEGLLRFPDTKGSPTLCVHPRTQAHTYAHVCTHMCAHTCFLDYVFCSLVPK